MQNLLNYTALAAGLAMTPRGIGALTATMVVGRIAGHVSNRVLIIISSLLMAYECFQFQFSTTAWAYSDLPCEYHRELGRDEASACGSLRNSPTAKFAP
jgi:hypothetical protein